MNIKYIVLRTEAWIRDLFKNKLFWIFTPIIIGLWFNSFLLWCYIANYSQETFTVNLNTYGEMNFELFLLFITLFMQLYSFVMILRWRWKYGRVVYNINMEDKK